MKNLLVKTSNWKFIIPALLAFIFCIYLFQTAQAKMDQIAGEEAAMIDMRNNYNLDEINHFFTKLESEGRKVHQQVTGITDMIFPFAYGMLFILLSAFFLKKITRVDSPWLYLSLFPILLMLADFKENFNTLKLLETFPYLTADMVDNASKITSLKAMLVNISMGLPVLLGIIWLIKWIMEKNRKEIDS